MEKKVVCYDIDGTLTKEMLFVPLIESEHKCGILKDARYASLMKTFKKYKEGRLDYEEAVQSLLQIHADSLKGIKLKTVSDNARNFVRENAKLFRPYVRPLIEKQSHNSMQFVVTAEPLYVAEAVSDYFGLDGAYASVYGIKSGEFTGGLTASLAFSKDKSALLSHYNVHAAFGDSAGDIDMLQTAKHSFCVDPDDELSNEAKAHGWHIITGEIKDVDTVMSALN